MKTESKSKSGQRAPDKTSLTISLPKELKEAIEAAANAEDRSVSNYLVIELKKAHCSAQTPLHGEARGKGKLT